MVLWFCRNTHVKNSILELTNLQRQYQILDDYLNNSLKKRMLIKPDGHCLLRAVFNGIKRKNLQTRYSNYKELFREGIFSIAHNEIYKFWITESNKAVLKISKQYEENKVYTSNTVDFFLSSLATIVKATSRVYYITDATVQNHIFIPLKNKSKVAIEVCFVNGHYDLVIQK